MGRWKYWGGLFLVGALGAGAGQLVSARGSVVLGAGGCLVDATDGCGCTDTPSRPPRQAPISGLKVSGVNDADNLGQAPVQPEGGSIEVTGSEVIVRYGQASILHDVRYRVLGP